ncbi:MULTISPECIES: VOC family protein [unclassified Fictibacillus]|uniref:VOC family protein n=1 Tax=unclassified Fictibacillus TaxID=2644029 RepID=UPI0007823F35|nr:MULTISPECIES: VOC family protein [unclassified Fictibacillus]MED2973502.1 VOC family protein [Fictibacillus sp. B-59209]SFE09293.1 Catechol 2,3-dioxygenase [Bacillus sp. OV194]
MKLNIKGIHHVQLCIPPGEEERARDFYTGVLGFSEIEKPESLKKNGGLWYQAGNQELHIGVENPESSKGKSHPAFEVAQLELVKQYLQSKEVVVKDETEIPGIIRFSFRDPFGNRIELLETLQ